MNKLCFSLVASAMFALAVFPASAKTVAWYHFDEESHVVLRLQAGVEHNAHVGSDLYGFGSFRRTGVTAPMRPRPIRFATFRLTTPTRGSSPRT